MSGLNHFLRVFAFLLGLSFMTLLGSGSAFAIDKIVLKDGTVVEGTIVREVEGFYWIKTQTAGVAQERMLTPDEVASVQRDAAASDPVPSGPVRADEKKIVKYAGGPRAAVITLGSRDPNEGNTIGVEIQAFELRKMIPMLEEELGNDGTGVVVLRITSGGGYLLEIQRLSDVIHNEYKKKFRTVAWIDSAISAAAMTAHAVEEIYFTPQGNYGACTGWSGAFEAVKGRELEEVLYQMEKISARGGYNPLIMRSMQIQDPLSATVDANGEVHWYADATSGEIVVNRDTEILTFNAETAAQVKFSKGTANSVEELGRAMGYTELTWVGEPTKNYIWPVCKAEKWNLDWRKKVHDDQENLNLLRATYGRQVEAARSEPLATRGKFVNMARATLGKLREATKRNPNMAMFVFGVYTDKEVQEWFDKQEKFLRDLMR